MDNSINAISRYASEMRFENLPAEVIHHAKRMLIDTLGYAIGAFDGGPCRIARAIARRSTGNPPARLLGTQEMSSPELAAFANATMVRFLDYNDSYLGNGSCHPSDTIPALLAAADAAHADGKSVLTATVLAYEVCCNFADVLPGESGWDNVFYDLVAGAVASGKLMGLTAAQLAHAIALAVIPNMTLAETRLGELSMWKGCAAANAARNGVFAAQLAQEGVTGPATAIEGRWGLWSVFGRFEWAPFGGNSGGNGGGISGGNGAPYRITQTHHKYYPAYVHAQSPISAALELHGQVNIEDIASIAINTYSKITKKYAKLDSPLWRPTTGETADHSIPYLVAAMLADGEISHETFSQQRIQDPRLHGLMKKMTMREDAEFNAARPTAWPCRLELTTNSGLHKTAAVQYFKGNVKNPLSDAEIETKFRQLAAGLLEPQQTDEVLARLWHLDELDDIGKVLDLLTVKHVPGH